MTTGKRQPPISDAAPKDVTKADVLTTLYCAFARMSKVNEIHYSFSVKDDTMS